MVELGELEVELFSEVGSEVVLVRDQVQQAPLITALALAFLLCGVCVVARLLRIRGAASRGADTSSPRKREVRSGFDDEQSLELTALEEEW